MENLTLYPPDGKAKSVRRQSVSNKHQKCYMPVSASTPLLQVHSHRAFIHLLPTAADKHQRAQSQPVQLWVELHPGRKPAPKSKPMIYLLWSSLLGSEPSLGWVSEWFGNTARLSTDSWQSKIEVRSLRHCLVLKGVLHSASPRGRQHQQKFVQSVWWREIKEIITDGDMTLEFA